MERTKELFAVMAVHILGLDALEPGDRIIATSRRDGRSLSGVVQLVAGHLQVLWMYDDHGSRRLLHQEDYVLKKIIRETKRTRKNHNGG